MDLSLPDLKPFLTIIAVIILCGGHTSLAVAYGVINDYGLRMYPWLALNVSPYVIVALIVEFKRERRALDQAFAPPRVWDVEKRVAEYCNEFKDADPTK